MNEQDFKKVFKTHKVDIPDDGFSERIFRQLPERKSIMPQIIMVASVVIGLGMVFSIRGFVPIMEQILSLVTSVSRLQMPSSGSIVTYIGLLTMTGTIGYSVMQTGRE
jgi:hypothetical protein